MALEPVTPAAPPRAKVEYTCPMHPEIVRDAPGACPICGMALEPRTVTGGRGRRTPSCVDMTRRFWIGLVADAAAARARDGRHDARRARCGTSLPAACMAWVQLVLATPVVLWGGWPFFERGWASVVNRSLNMFTLIALGTGAAYVYSVVATLAPGLFPASFRGHGGEVGVYFEAAAVITTLVLLGQVLELRARSQTSSAIRALLGLAPPTARRVARRRRGGGRAARATSRSATACASGPARRCRWTASCSRAPARSTSRWSPASRSRSRRRRRAASSAAP